MTPDHATGGTVEITIRSIGTGGEGVGQLPDGRTCFIHRTAPQDRVRARILQERPRWARARLDGILEPGPDRRSPPCGLYDRCGGCTLQHLTYPAQLAAKRSIVQETLRRVGGIDVEVDEPVPSPRQLGYRNRVSFTLRRLRSGRVVAGFHSLHEPGRIEDVDGECLLPGPGILRAWTALRAAWGHGAERLPRGDSLRLTLRRQEESVLLLVEGGAQWQGAQELLSDVDGLSSIWWAPTGGGMRRVASTGAAGAGTGEEGPAESPWAFSQVNPEVGAALAARVLEEADVHSGHRVVDAYAGVGGHAAQAARMGARVVTIEMDEQAVSLARRELPDSVEVRQGSVEDLLAACLPAHRVILNPPRAGVHPRVPEALCHEPVERMVYVSCDPATLARDLKRLSPAYRVIRVQVLDMFPQTAHMETLVTLEALDAPSADPDTESSSGALLDLAP